MSFRDYHPKGKNNSGDCLLINSKDAEHLMDANAVKQVIRNYRQQSKSMHNMKKFKNNGEEGMVCEICEQWYHIKFKGISKA